MFDVESIEAEYFTLDEFKFNNGETLKDVKVEYISFGTPKYDNNWANDASAPNPTMAPFTRTLYLFFIPPNSSVA